MLLSRRIAARVWPASACIIVLVGIIGLLRSPVLADDSPAASVPVINPVELRIPAIGVDANVQDVALAPDGSMDIPSNFTDVAWYTLGYAPGQAGNAVFDGHVSSTDAAGVFFNIQDLVPGNLVSVIGDDGTVLTFQVDDVESYPLDSAPVDTIFGSTGVPQIVLITCGGDWHPDVHLFDHRTVVYAPLVSVTPAP
jgi:sortase A